MSRKKNTKKNKPKRPAGYTPFYTRAFKSILWLLALIALMQFTHASYVERSEQATVGQYEQYLSRVFTDAVAIQPHHLTPRLTDYFVLTEDNVAYYVNIEHGHAFAHFKRAINPTDDPALYPLFEQAMSH